MLTNESQARKAMLEASKELESALSKYTTARAKLAEITGEIQSIDNKLSLTFKAQDGQPRGATIALTDC